MILPNFVEIEKEDLIKVEGKEKKGDVRKLREILPIVFEKGRWVNEFPQDKPLYFMFRDIFKESDKDFLKEKDVRFDITVIPAFKLGKEFVKTHGHYHPLIPGKSITYPEIYEIISGKCMFVLQKPDENGNIVDAFVVECEEGDKIVIPPNYGHVMVNIGYETLITSNLVSSKFKSIYEPYREKKGAVYYILSEFMKIKMVKNEAYDNVNDPVILKPSEKILELLSVGKEESLYKLVEERSDVLEFLNDPERFKDLCDKMSVFL